MDEKKKESKNKNKASKEIKKEKIFGLMLRITYIIPECEYALTNIYEYDDSPHLTDTHYSKLKLLAELIE